MSDSPITLFGSSVYLQTSATPTSPTSIPLVASLISLDRVPSQVRLLSDDINYARIWFNFSAPLPLTASQPGVGTVDIGSPVPTHWIVPGDELVLTLPPVPKQLTQLAGSPYGIYLNLYSTAASQGLYLQFCTGADSGFLA